MYAASLKALAIYLIAIVIAMAAAALIRGIVALLGRQGHRGATTATAVGIPAVATASDPAPVGPEQVAAIAAALHMVIGDHRIVHIEEARKGSGWVAEGRQAHHASHAVDHHQHGTAPQTRDVKR